MTAKLRITVAVRQAEIKTMVRVRRVRLLYQHSYSIQHYFFKCFLRGCKTQPRGTCSAILSHLKTERVTGIQLYEIKLQHNLWQRLAEHCREDNHRKRHWVEVSFLSRISNSRSSTPRYRPNVLFQVGFGCK